MTITYSPQQVALFDWVDTESGNLFLRARAGTGKTTTLVGAMGRMSGSVAYAAYNKKIAVEVKTKLEKAAVDMNGKRSGTFHSYGFAACRRVLPSNVVVDEKKKRDRIVSELQIPPHLEAFSMRLVSLAKNSAMGLFGSPDDQSLWWRLVEHHDLLEMLENDEHGIDGIRCAWKALRLSNNIVRENIDFDDMIYLPVVNRYRVWQNDWLLVDEAQDTNPCRRALARMMLRPGGRAIFVGDDRQAIYGFTGADADAVDLIISDFACKVLPLTVTYRCPKTIVAEAKVLVEDYEAHETAPEGEVRRIQSDMLLQEGMKASDAILCRKTAPLVETAFKLIRNNIPCHIEGREIGQGLIKLATRWRVKSTDALRNKLETYCEREVAKFMAKGLEGKAEQVVDRVETLYVLMEGCDTVECVKQKIEKMFKDDEPNLTLSTIHKSKGREWPRVYMLGRHQYMPSPMARQQWQMLQEQNLIYVGVTRAMETLTYVDVAA